jgi:shikimate kinase
MVNLPERIFLIGYRGAGKTTVAGLLAERLCWAWIDADAELERRAGKSIGQIFAEEGEAAFRRRESALLPELARRTQQIIATGGGVVLDPVNRGLLRASGFVVWLTAAAATLQRRIEQDRNTAHRRPRLTVGGLAEIQQLLDAREPFYRECAHCTVETNDLTTERAVAQILAAIDTHAHAV